jgi:hypothetical protein
MIGYAPIEEPVMAPVVARVAPTNQVVKKQSLTKFDTTECNYLVMFFVLGVIGLVIKDMSSKR